jgi:succinyl-CoA synthetase beta subunit|tara:strand:+ start:2800 stop:2988 length:189 start_codon:yes stop_codon:yes gene_type:complete
MAIPLIVAGAGLTLAILDRLAAFKDKSATSAKETKNLVTEAVIPLVVLAAAGTIAFQLLRKK